MGIQYVDITPATEAGKPAIKQANKIAVNTGIYIKDVLVDLSAWKAGLRVGDVIRSINGAEITRQLPFLYQLYSHIPGDQVDLGIIRNGSPLILKILLD